MSDDIDDVPFDRQREVKITNAGDANPSSTLTGGNSMRVRQRNYKCPACGGEFTSWDSYHANGSRKVYQCPFCGLERGEYDPNEDSNDGGGGE